MKQQLRQVMDDIEAVFGKRKPMLSVAEFATMCGVSPKTVWEWCASGELPASQTKKWAPYRISYRELLRFQEAAHAA
ncbi:helix-turn-helix domain-containing protein [Corynebacterium heidelbergense]|uniref:Helix-turn-helix domain-containing protein n=1 Tax=Corynebacterium heidelbergense TaxID=2055947 RepID=A0A364VE11_9CORY|nr:helix-turn-helix domain-containing protein [Corynebacterium heidelbergense]RAV34880.1 hypothetical protein CWC39_00645 [Corynebacterium heidelbergense]WCZ36015.1 Helix-turn-helix domain protein [Corynebacterium heidelbergense]